MRSLHAQIFLNNLDVTVFGQAHFGVGIGPIHLDNLRCTGNEASILDCRSTIPDCSHEEDAGVRCDPTRKINVFRCLNM